MRCLHVLLVCRITEVEVDVMSMLVAGRSGVLLPGGHLVLKLLHGSGSEELCAQLKRHFEKVSWVQPKATRQESREMYLVGIRRTLAA